MDNCLSFMCYDENINLVTASYRIVIKYKNIMLELTKDYLGIYNSGYTHVDCQ